MDDLLEFILEAPEGFKGNLPSHAHVALGIKIDRPTVRHDLTAALRRRRVDDGAPTRIAEELQRHLISPGLERFAPGRLRGRPLRVIRAFEFMIAGRILEQLVDRRRVVVGS